MPDFTYEALAKTGTKSNGTLTANSEREVMTMLDARGLFPVRIELARTAVSFSSNRRVRSRHMAGSRKVP